MTHVSGDGAESIYDLFQHKEPGEDLSFENVGSCKVSSICDLPSEIMSKVWCILTASKDRDRYYDSLVKERDNQKRRRDEWLRYRPINIERSPNATLQQPKEVLLHHDTALRSCCKQLRLVCDTARTCIFLRESFQASAESYVQKLTHLKAVSIEYAPLSDVRSSLASLYSIQPALSSLILYASTHRTLIVDINQGPPAWASTLQHLELHHMTSLSGSQQQPFSLSFLSHLTALKELMLHHVSPFLKTTDISGCLSLQKLTLQGGHLHFDVSIKAETILDLSSLTSMQELSCDCYSLTQLNVACLAAMKILVCTHNRLKQLDLSSCTLLQQLSCSDNNLVELDLTHNQNLRLLDCSANPLSNLKMSSCTLLADFKCGGSTCTITELSLAVYAHLHTFECAGMQFCTLDVHAVPQLEVIRVYGCEKLLALDLSGLQKLRQVSVQKSRERFFKSSALLSLDVSGCTSLVVLDCAESFELTTLCASGCSKLNRLDISRCPIKTLNLVGCFQLSKVDGVRFHNHFYFRSSHSLDLASCVGLWDVTSRITGEKLLNVLPSAATLLTLECRRCAQEMLDAYGNSNNIEYMKIYCWGGQELKELLCVNCGGLEKLSSLVTKL